MPQPRVSACGRLFIVHHAEVPDVDGATEEMKRFAAHAGGSAAPLLMVIDKVFPPMGNDVRRVYRAAVEGEPGVAAMAALVDGVVGMGASLVLSVITNIFGGRARLPMKMFREPKAAAGWLCEEADVGATADEVIAAIEALRKS